MNGIKSPSINKATKRRQSLALDAACPPTYRTRRAALVIHVQRARHDEVVSSVHRAAELEHVPRGVQLVLQSHCLASALVEEWHWAKAVCGPTGDAEFDAFNGTEGRSAVVTLLRQADRLGLYPVGNFPVQIK